MRWLEVSESLGSFRDLGAGTINDIKRKVFGRLGSVQVAVTIYITGQTAGEEFERVSFLSKNHRNWVVVQIKSDLREHKTVEASDL